MAIEEGVLQWNGLWLNENYNIKMLADNFAISKNKKSEFGRKIRDFGKHKKTLIPIQNGFTPNYKQ